MTEAARYQSALDAPSWQLAEQGCNRLAVDANRGDCLVAAMERWDRVERADCENVPVGIWREECLFLYAERAHRAGDRDAAFAACLETSFGRECSYHLIREAARSVKSQPMDVAILAVEPYRALPRAPDAPQLFWRAWFREQIARDAPVDPTGCPDERCLQGAKETVFQRLNGLLTADAAGFCAHPPWQGGGADGRGADGRALWADTSETAAWVRGWSMQNCARVGHPIGDPSSGAPLSGTPPPDAAPLPPG